MSNTPKPRLVLRRAVVADAAEHEAVRELEDWAQALRLQRAHRPPFD